MERYYHWSLPETISSFFKYLCVSNPSSINGSATLTILLSFRVDHWEEKSCFQKARRCACSLMQLGSSCLPRGHRPVHRTVKQRQQSLKLEQDKKPVLWGGFLNCEQKGARKTSPALPSGFSLLKSEYNLLIPVPEGLEYNS